MTGGARRRAARAAGLALALAATGAVLSARGAPGTGTALLGAGALAAALATVPGGLAGAARRRLAALAGARDGGPPSPPTGEAVGVPPLAGRPAFVASGLALLAVAVAGTAGNHVSPGGALGWIASVAVLARGLADPGEARRERTPVPRGVAVSLLALTVAAGALRIGAFPSAPPEPTSDHVEKALDAVRIREGARPVFCPSNGGREPVQMYLLALLSLLPGLALDLNALTLLTALEGTLTVPLLFLAGRELARPQGRRAADLAGLAAAALGAACGWHVVLSRLGLRIVLLPAVTLLLLAVLLRAVRDGRRRDWLLAGLVAGLSLYTYQSARFLPLLVAAGALLSGRSTPAARRRLLGNVAAAALLAVAAAAPLARYAFEFPEAFWARARTRLLGDGASADPAAALRARLPGLVRGAGPALDALHVRGDAGWFQADPGRPFLDPARPFLFLLAPRDEAGLAELRALFPDAHVRRGIAAGPERGWVAVEVPAEGARRAGRPAIGSLKAPAPGPSRG